MQKKSNSGFRYIVQYVLSELKQKISDKYTYHDVRHTLDVMEVCQQYAAVYDLDEKQSELLQIAAVCHDYGYIISADNHEMTGADMASMIMAAYQYQDRDIRTVRRLIHATNLHTKPQDLMECIMADADLDYLSRSDYPEISERLYREWWATGRRMTRATWLNNQIAFLSQHRYHTDFARVHKTPLKLERLKKLKASSATSHGENFQVLNGAA